jgi:hypothetical protein
MIQRVQDKFDRQSLDSVTANKVATFNDRDLYACICGLDDVSLPKTPPTLMDQEFANREKGMRSIAERWKSSMGSALAGPIANGGWKLGNVAGELGAIVWSALEFDGHDVVDENAV